MQRALAAAEQKGETPIFAGRLKQMMLGLDSSFNEANYGFQQFRALLEAYPDLVSIQEQGLQLYVSLRKPGTGPGRPSPAEQAAEPAPPLIPPPVAKPAADQGQRYRSFLREAGLRVVEPHTRQQIVADFLAVLQAQPTATPLSVAATSCATAMRPRTC